MAEIKKYLLKDAQGNSLFPKTSSDIVVHGESTVSAVLDTLQNAIADKTPCSVVATIAERDALTPLKGDLCWVEDATGDSTVSTGAAKYLYNGTAWVKVSEAESMDLVFDWANIQNKPSSVVADIDDAVSKKHSHANAAELDKLVNGDEINAAGDFVADLTVTAADLNDAAGKAHEHTNTVAEIDAAVDSVQEKASGWDDAASKAHEHSNKAELDAITATGAQINAAAAFVEALEADAAAVDGAVDNAHTHANKELLDGISASGETVTINGKTFYAQQDVAFIASGAEIPATLSSNGIVFEAI